MIKIVYFCVCCSLLQPTEQNTYADIEAAYECLKQTYGVKEEDVILYGQSVGSGPTVDLASRLSRLRAVVLHSPILSGVRVMYPVKRTYWFDIFKVIMIQTCKGSPLVFFICLIIRDDLCDFRILTKFRWSNAQCWLFM